MRLKITFSPSLFLFLLLLLPLRGTIEAQIIPAGSGSYTTTFPGVDAAGRNSFPSGNPYLTGNAAGKPVPTNDWWSAKVKNPHADNLFNYPYTLKTVNDGLVVSYIPWGVIDNILPVIVGVSGLNASAANISDYSDWTITMDWQNASHHFQATSGIGMPFLYFEKDAADLAEITVNQGTVVIDNEMLIITDARNGADFAVYAPVGSVWMQNGNSYTSTLDGKNYWSMAFIPLDATNITTVANEYKSYAYVFPTNTTTTWDYDETTSLMTTDFVVSTDVKEGTETDMLLGLLPHQWANLAANSPTPNQYSYASVRGELKTLAGNSFSVSNRFHGILPTLPYVDYYSDGFSPAQLATKTQSLQNDGLSTWTDSYNEGQMMNRLIQTARIADMTGDTIARDKMIATVKERLEDWLSAEASEVAFLFYYNQNWTAMLGYPAGHGQDGNINDHHFHWGYFIHAAAFMEQFEPGWASQWGDMIQFLIRDAACPTRDDPMFPLLRNFSPYAGHCWANGFASFPQGNDQESTSESMQFNSSLIHWGAITGNDSIRDLGIYLYTTEQTAIEEYWFDTQERNFQPNQQYSLVSRVWGNSYDNGTFWTADIAASYGIELYPIHGGSLYLGHDTTYTRKLWNEITQNTGILNNEANVNLWHDVMWEYLAFIEPAEAIALYDSYPERELKFGISDAQTYHWLHAMNSLGQIDTSVTANSPLAATFSKAGQKIYVAHNYGADTLDVLYSDGYLMQVPPASIRTSLDISLRGTLSSSFPAAYPGGKVSLDLQVAGGLPTQVEFFDGDSLLGQVSQAPFVFDAADLTVGRHTFFAKIYDGSNFNLSNLVEVIVGDQLPYTGYPVSIPGDIEAGQFDLFEGGIGQGISYNDASTSNNGNFRENEYVDVSLAGNEGAIVSFINPGEWLEYSIDVQQAGFYDLSFRYASGNNAGGGPFRLLSDGDTISDAIN
ncbi:MAG: glycosyl hydrolase, partial [Bacteroidota bacterium]